MEQTRKDLKIKFSDGKRPSGNDFGDLLESFVNTKDDSIKKDSQGNFIITLGDIESASKGTIRFHDSKIQYFDGAAWQDVGTGSGGGFKVVPAAGSTPESITYNSGTVRINTGDAVPAAGAKLEVNFSAATDKVKLGNAAISNGSQTFASSAQFSHNSKSNNNTDFALRQSAAGDVVLNAPPLRKLTLAYQGTDIRLCVVPPNPPAFQNGSVVVGDETALTNSGDAVFQVQGNVYIAGTATKTSAGEWAHSDIRLKKDIKPFKDGLAKILRMNPVQFKYNGKSGTPADLEQIGVIGQEIEHIMPYTISKRPGRLNEDESPTDIIYFNPDAITYVLVNAIQELSAKVDKLQNRLEQAALGVHS